MIKQLRKLSMVLGLDLSELIRYAGSEEYKKGDKVRVISGWNRGQECQVIYVDEYNDEIELDCSGLLFTHGLSEVELLESYEAETGGYSVGDVVKIWDSEGGDYFKGEIASFDRDAYGNSGANVEIWGPYGSRLRWHALENLELLGRAGTLNEFWLLSQKDGFKFIRDVVTKYSFEDFSDDQIKMVEGVLKNQLSYLNSDYRLWRNSFGEFFIQYPEYINASLFGEGIFAVIFSLLEGHDSELLQRIPESLLFEVWNNNGLMENDPVHYYGLHQIISDGDLFKKFMFLYPGFAEMLAFLMATRYPGTYMHTDMNDYFSDKINLDDVIEHFVKRDPVEFLEWPGSAQHPDLEKKAVYRLVSGKAYWLAYFFNSPNRYYIKYPELTKAAMDTFVNRDYNLQLLGSFIESNLGKEMFDRMLGRVMETDNYKRFFGEGFHYVSKDAGWQMVQKLLATNDEKMIVQYFGRYNLLDSYPAYAYIYNEIVDRMDEGVVNDWIYKEMDEEDDIEYHEEDEGLSESEKEKKKFEDDPDYMEHFDKE